MNDTSRQQAVNACTNHSTRELRSALRVRSSDTHQGLAALHHEALRTDAGTALPKHAQAPVLHGTLPDKARSAQGAFSGSVGTSPVPSPRSHRSNRKARGDCCLELSGRQA